MAEVVVVGAGPVGLLLAGELARAGIDVRVFERRPEGGGGTRAIGIHAPVLAALEQSGLTQQLLAHALRIDRGEARADGRVLGVVRFDRLSTRFPFVATLPQAATEAVLTARVPRIERSRTVTGVRLTEDGAVVEVEGSDGGEEVHARIVIVASGWTGRDLVYRSVSSRIYPDRYLMADVAVGDADREPTAVVHLAPGGVLESFPLPGGVRRFVAWDSSTDVIDDPASARRTRLASALRTRGEPEASVALLEGEAPVTTFGVRRVRAHALRRRSIIVVGDAGHEVSPIGGQGMNLGLLDAATLAPLVVRWIRAGSAPDAELARWEQRRLRSAASAGRLAAVNTTLGRPRGAVGHAVRSGLLRAVLAQPQGMAFTSAYAMGLDADA